MDNFKLATKICQAIVDGRLSGYLNYLDERRKKKDEMNVSGAYAWTKGNHIDDQISKLANGQGLSFIPDKAGYTWEYLKFILNEQNENYLIIIKNSKRIQQTFDGKELKDDNYLVEFSDINTAPFITKPLQHSLVMILNIAYHIIEPIGRQFLLVLLLVHLV